MEPGKKKNYNATKVWLRALTSALGNFSFGYMNGVFTSSQECVSKVLGWGDSKHLYISVVSALLPLGALFGAVLASLLAKQFGKRKELMITDLVTVLSSALIVIPSTGTFGIGRFIAGISSGLFLTLSMQYINEFTPAEIRGKMGSLTGFTNMIGLLMAYSVCLLFPIDYCTQSSKYYVFAIFGLPGLAALLQFIIFFSIFPNESPVWLIKGGENQLALQSLETIYEQNCAEIEFTALISARKKLLESTDCEEFSLKDILTCKEGSRRSTRLGLFFHVFQQLTGINAVLSYSTNIFHEFGDDEAKILTIFTGILRLIAVVILFPMIDSTGRKKITVVSQFLMGVCFFTMVSLMGIDGLEVTLVVFLCLFLMLFAVSIGPICWIYTTEILNDKAMGLCAAVNWGTCFLIVLFFPLMIQHFGLGNVFAFYAIFNVIGSVYFYIDMVETKGKTKEEIKEMFSHMG